MVRFGAEMVFSSKDSTITDEDIDRIIAKGEEATAELDAKMKKFAEDAIKFKMDDSMWIDIEIYLLNIFLLYAFATEAKCNLSGFSQLLIYMILMMKRYIPFLHMFGYYSGLLLPKYHDSRFDSQFCLSFG